MDNTTANGDQGTQSIELKDVQTQIAELKKKEDALLKLNKEPFSFRKFFRGLNLFDLVGWAKWISGFARTAVVLAIVAGIYLTFVGSVLSQTVAEIIPPL